MNCPCTRAHQVFRNCQPSTLMAPGSAPRVNMAEGIVRTPVAKMTVRRCGQHGETVFCVDALTLQEDDRSVNPRDGSEVDQAFSCSEDFSIFEIGLPYVNAVGAALCWLDDVFMLFVRHDGHVLGMYWTCTGRGDV